jgi:hypothetical protein
MLLTLRVENKLGVISTPLGQDPVGGGGGGGNSKTAELSNSFPSLHGPQIWFQPSRRDYLTSVECMDGSERRVLRT